MFYIAATAGAGHFRGSHPGAIAVATMTENVVQVGLLQAKLPALQFFWRKVG